jgi:protein-tyrosine-phosphatase
LPNPWAPEIDFVLTVCDNAATETCPIWPGQPMTAHWGVPDPAAVAGNEATRMMAFRQAFRELENRVQILNRAISNNRRCFRGRSNPKTSHTALGAV